MRTSWPVGMLLLALLILSPGREAAVEPRATAAEQADVKRFPPEVERLNTYARRMYAEARTRELATIPAIIYVSDDDLVLVRKGKRTVAHVVPADYHTLKGVAHSTLGLFTLLAHDAGKPLGEDRLKDLKEFQTRVNAAGPAVEKYGFDAETLDRQKRILGRAQQLIAKAMQDGKVSPDDLAAYARSSRADVLANARGSARAQLTAMHKQMTEWKKELTPEEWSTLTVIVPAAATARKDNTVVQYFARLFGETTGESDRIIYAESIYEEEKAMNLLGTLRLDSKLAATMFGDRFRLWRDFLADGGRSVIDEILAPTP
jgi:hypothetical protein